jgi:uncharacterized membrane-anchored protein
MTINPVKNKFVLFRTKNKKINYDLKILINNKNIKQVKNTTFLGIVIDEFLTWSEHLNFISKKIIKCAAIISKIRHYTNLNSLKLICYAYIMQPNLGKYIQILCTKVSEYKKKL